MCLKKELLLLLKQNDRTAFGNLYQCYWKQVYNFSRLYLKVPEDAEEVVQEVFIKVWDSRALLREDDNFKGLLFIITRNIIFNQSKRKINEDFFRTTILATLEESYDVEQEIESKNLKEYIDVLIAEMPAQRQLVFKLSRNEHKTYKEIAAQLNIADKTVERHINEALKTLRKNIKILLIFIN
ncbi:DNA-directed RNA polymerase sigma-70 factor [Bacteroidales bacterium]|nr:DNA-directed RNA polymerase sigma-70 factor [Bacteroidales bacterium]